jgi:ubiquinone/menaquinone biosynthesis C-methylase UbiE
MIAPRHIVDPVSKRRLSPDGDDLLGADGQRYPSFGGGWDLRPRTPGATLDDANKSLHADIYDTRIGELSDFDHPHNLMLVHQRRLLEALPLSPGDRVLEIGGHRSGLLPWLERTRGITGNGLDISPVWVRAQNAAARARRSDTVWVLGDAEALPFADESFNAVIALDVLEHLTHLDRAVTEAYRVLRPKGRFIVHMPVQDIDGSFDGWQRWRDAADYAARQASNVWVQPLHDHRLVPLLGRLKNGRRRRASSDAPSTGARSTPPASGTSGFTRAYARYVVPVAGALASIDRVGSALGIGGSCFFVAQKP